ncbi:MAG: addiction module protein [Candidatus Marinimicrobia bacterium]|nr:addiction module protein [Candidatus Neomarinimicrobiota bacterium]
MTTLELTKEVSSLPIEQRLKLADIILESINPPNHDIEKEWIRVAKSRLVEIQSGKVDTIPMKQVMQKLENLFKK